MVYKELLWFTSAEIECSWSWTSYKGKAVLSLRVAMAGDVCKDSFERSIDKNMNMQCSMSMGAGF